MNAPPKVPADFTRPTMAYRLQAWVAMLGLLFFVALYVGLASYFTYTAYRMLRGVFAGGDGAVAGFFAAIPACFLAVFMWKALFFVRAGSDNIGMEIKPDDEPKLFAFLHEIADQAGAPRPHRVFLTPNVNACVFYDLSILNFILPSKKNLGIGLGLVNRLNRGEMKAVLAHEFGHFAQRTMAVSRWVYVGEQIAGHIIAKRDALDRMLDFISSIDLRLAWIGWIMRTVVWSIRSLMESVFKLVVVAQRALSREMEFHADKVAVSLAGSDALVHGLYRLQSADEDWDSALSFANDQLHKGLKVTDLFSIQSSIGEQMRRILSDPNRGIPPDLPTMNAAAHRVFTEQLAQPPKMWSTHPPNTEREENAKEIYIASPVDDSSAWDLFQDPGGLRERLTETLFKEMVFEKQPAPMSSSQAEVEIKKKYAVEVFDPKYRGAYLGRKITINAKEPSQLYGTTPVESVGDLYPASLSDLLSDLRNLNEEIVMLDAIDAGAFGNAGGMIRHRGETVRRSRLPKVIDNLKAERQDVIGLIEQHDRLCRTTHDIAARHVANGWQEYLRSLTGLLHYAEHAEADLRDAHSHLANITSIAIATGRVSNTNLDRVMGSAHDLHRAMVKVERQAKSIEAPANVLRDLDAPSWSGALDQLKLPPPARENLGDWLGVIDSWAQPMMERLSQLSRAVLTELLHCEQKVAAMFDKRSEPQPAPAPATIPSGYATLLPGEERKKQKKLGWWARFTLADGTGPAVLRTAVAGAIVGAVVMAGAYVGSATIAVFNGLGTPVIVSVDGKKIEVQPWRHRELSLGAKHAGKIETKTTDGRLVESFEASFDKGFATYVYNVASAAPMVEWDAAYGNARPSDPRILGCPRWRTTGVSYVFEEPPRQIKMKSKGAIRTVLSSAEDAGPQSVLGMIADESELQNLILAQAKWTPSESEHAVQWLQMATAFDGFEQIIETRLKQNPLDVVTLRAQQEFAKSTDNDEILAKHRQLAAEHPNNPGIQYVSIRAQEDGPEQDAAFLRQQAKHPDHDWLNYAAAYVHVGQMRWKDAERCFEKSFQSQGSIASGAALQLYRVRRMIHGETLPTNLIPNDSSVQTVLLFEQGTELTGPSLAYSKLRQGKLQDAYQIAGGENAPVGMRVLLATSKDADADWQAKAFEIPVEELSEPIHALYLAALAHRNGKDKQRYVDQFKKTFRKTQSAQESIDRFFHAAQSRGEFNDVLRGLFAADQGAFYAAGCILLNEKAPARWREAARRLLIVTECPAL